MVFAYMDHDLAGLLENERVILHPSHIKIYMKQLLEGTEYMHLIPWKLGIATSYTLPKAGHHVLLIESIDGRSRVSVQVVLPCFLILTIGIA